MTIEELDLNKALIIERPSEKMLEEFMEVIKDCKSDKAAIPFTEPPCIVFTSNHELLDQLIITEK